MKKLIVLAMIMAVIVLVAALVRAQGPANDLKPTFISPTPGLYVSGWPAFTVSYPKEWVELVRGPVAVFAAGAARADVPPNMGLPMLAIDVFPSTDALEDWAEHYMHFWVMIATDVKVLSDKPSRLKDGTLAREQELEWVIKNGPKANVFQFMTKRESTWVAVILMAAEGKLGADVKSIAYSLTFQPDREKPVQVPPDVRAFLDMFCADRVSVDVTAVMEHYSDRFLNSGMSQAVIERASRDYDPTFPSFAPHRGIISQEATVTVFEAHGDKAYVDGFFLVKAKGDATALKEPMRFQQIINEHGEWKWFGNQR